ncbi:MAG TPA: hypothetical protein VGI96_36790, partial [Streptosporangiaceae bacterium]
PRVTAAARPFFDQAGRDVVGQAGDLDQPLTMRGSNGAAAGLYAVIYRPEPLLSLNDAKPF